MIDITMRKDKWNIQKSTIENNLHCTLTKTTIKI